MMGELGFSVSFFYISALILSILATYMWRFFGVLVVLGLQEDGEFFIFLRFVAISIVAALCTRLIVLPPEAFSDISLFSRLSAMFMGVVIFYFFGRQAWIGVFGSCVVLYISELGLRFIFSTY